MKGLAAVALDGAHKTQGNASVLKYASPAVAKRVSYCTLRAARAAVWWP